MAAVDSPLKPVKTVVELSISDSDKSISLNVERKRTSAELPLSTRIRPTSQFDTFNVRTSASS
ncbi:hypothetical protein TIFTF001_042551 [Ficus carica]|uniref:Uncharacterized protein n=1 Tax=Ficus carica TaxID=3494 RepID=A0AA87ZPB1_FICCA|nr:hypothetical protein TIFTF001_042551 [Ficus carica]